VSSLEGGSSSHELWRTLGRVATSKKFRELRPRKVHQLSNWRPTTTEEVWGSNDLNNISQIIYFYLHNSIPSDTASGASWSSHIGMRCRRKAAAPSTNEYAASTSRATPLALLRLRPRISFGPPKPPHLAPSPPGQDAHTPPQTKKCSAGM
jgi:hypothetical protein